MIATAHAAFLRVRNLLRDQLPHQLGELIIARQRRAAKIQRVVTDRIPQHSISFQSVICGEIAEGGAITVDVADGAFIFPTTQPEPIAIPEPVAA